MTVVSQLADGILAHGRNCLSQPFIIETVVKDDKCAWVGIRPKYTLAP
jgi:hypothetical protein